MNEHQYNAFVMAAWRCSRAMSRTRQRDNDTARRMAELQANGASVEQINAIWEEYYHLNRALEEIECWRISWEYEQVAKVLQRAGL